MTPSPSENLLRRLAGVSPTTAFVIALVIFLGGLFLPGIVGAALLVVLGVALAALTFTTWPVQSPALRTVRVILLGLLFVTAVAKAL
ncbi:DUF6703 family protein [Actinoplanes sp. NPDC049681]|uniref:DUF6703 family protein n=1 Tax=Actinoplanes sp. NPDC049681 TaxID=3363905 RepID=UPI00379A25B5